MASDASSDEKVTEERKSSSTFASWGEVAACRAVSTGCSLAFFVPPPVEEDILTGLGTAGVKSSRAGDSGLHPAEPVPWYLGAAESVLVCTL